MKNISISSVEKTRKAVVIGVFSALAYICVFLFRIEVVFLTFEAKDAVITIGGMFFGPVAAALMSLITSFFEYISVSGTGVLGLLMNFVGSATFSVIPAVIYSRKKTLTNAIVGLIAGSVAMTAVMLLMNLVITPYYYGVTVKEVIAMIPSLLLPFNVMKTILNSSIVLVLYKPIATALRRARLVKEGPVSYKMDRKSIAVILAGLAIFAGSIAILLIVLSGNIKFFQ